MAITSWLTKEDNCNHIPTIIMNAHGNIEMLEFEEKNGV